MNLPKIGDVLYVKTTDEPVLVVATRQMNESDSKRFPANEGCGTIIIVRRPVSTDSQGIRYQFYDFLAEELQTADERAQAYYENLKKRRDMVLQDAEISGPLSGGIIDPLSHKN
jgi:hypothetical protein